MLDSLFLIDALAAVDVEDLEGVLDFLEQFRAEVLRANSRMRAIQCHLLLS